MGYLLRVGALLAACGLGGCGDGEDACDEDARFSCSDLVRVVPLTEDACCGDLMEDAVCVDGAWQCPEDTTRECLDYWVGNQCASLRED